MRRVTVVAHYERLSCCCVTIRCALRRRYIRHERLLLLVYMLLAFFIEAHAASTPELRYICRHFDAAEFAAAAAAHWRYHIRCLPPPYTRGATKRVCRAIYTPLLLLIRRFDFAMPPPYIVTRQPLILHAASAMPVAAKAIAVCFFLCYYAR